MDHDLDLHLIRSIRGYQIQRCLESAQDRALFVARGGMRGERVLVELIQGPQQTLEAVRNSATPWLKIRHQNLIPLREIGIENGVLYAVYPFVVGATLERVAESWLVQNGEALNEERVLSSIRQQQEGADQNSGDEKVWRKGFEKTAADLFSQLARAIEFLQSHQKFHGQVQASRIWLTPYSRALLLAPCTAAPANDDLRRLGAIFQSVVHDFAQCIDVELDKLVYASNAKHPSDRYATAAAFVSDLSRYLQSEPVLAKRPGPVVKLTRSLIENPRKTAAGLIALLLSAGAVWMSFDWAKNQNRPASVVKPTVPEKPVEQQQPEKTNAEIQKKPTPRDQNFRSSIPGYVSGKGSNLSPR